MRPNEPATVSFAYGVPVPIPIKYDPNQDDALKLTYNQVKIDADDLAKTITLLKNRYSEVEAMNKKGEESCLYWYESGVSKAKTTAENLKNSYSASRSGFGTQMAPLNEIDQALKYDLVGLENEYESCKAKYYLNKSIKSDINKLNSDRGAILSRLTIENSPKSLDDIRSLFNRAFNIADKF